MSVLIKGMQMPENCLECDIRCYDADAGEEYCPFNLNECLSIGRQNDCPLVALPEKHGRLIDADKLMREEIRPFHYHLPNGDEAIPIVDILHAQTVVDAEGEE